MNKCKLKRQQQNQKFPIINTIELRPIHSAIEKHRQLTVFFYGGERGIRTLAGL